MEISNCEPAGGQLLQAADCRAVGSLVQGSKIVKAGRWGQVKEGQEAKEPQTHLASLHLEIQYSLGFFGSKFLNQLIFDILKKD